MMQTIGRLSGLAVNEACAKLQFPKEPRESITTDFEPQTLSKKLKKFAEEHSEALSDWSKGKSKEKSKTAMLEAYAKIIGAEHGAHSIGMSTEKDGKKELISLFYLSVTTGERHEAAFSINGDIATFVSFKIVAGETKAQEPKVKPKDEHTRPTDLSKFVEVLTSQDKDKRGEELRKNLVNDPALKSAMKVYSEFEALETAGSVPKCSSVRDRVERVAWISRTIYFDRKQVSTETVLAADKQILTSTEAARALEMCKGRSAVFLAHMETLADLTFEEPEKADAYLSPFELGRYRRLSGDDHVFGKSATVEAIRSQTGKDSLTFIRPEDGSDFAVLKVLKTHQLVLARWSTKDSDSVPTKAEIALVKTDLKMALGLKEEDTITVGFAITKEMNSANFEINLDGKEFVRASVHMTKGVPDDISITTKPTTSALSAAAAKEKTLAAVAKQADGENGFLFVFDGHGRDHKMYLSHGQPRQGGFVEQADTVTISTTELAKAFVARQKKFGGGDKDIIVLACCMSQDLGRDLAQEIIKLGGVTPIIICQTEQGQYGYSNIVHPHGGAFKESVFRADPKKARTVGDVIDDFQNHQKFNSNPSIFVPSKNKGIIQISDNRINSPAVEQKGLASS